MAILTTTITIITTARKNQKISNKDTTNANEEKQTNKRWDDIYVFQNKFHLLKA